MIDFYAVDFSERHSEESLRNKFLLTLSVCSKHICVYFVKGEVQ